MQKAIRTKDLDTGGENWEALNDFSRQQGEDGSIIAPKASGKGIKLDRLSPSFGWRNIIGHLIIRTVGVGSPSESIYIGAQVKAYSFANGDAVNMMYHIPHYYVPGTDLFLDSQWSHNGTAIEGSAVIDYYYTYAKGHNQANFVTEKNLTLTVLTPNIATVPQYRHRVDELQLSIAGGSATQLNSADIEPDGVIQMRLIFTTIPTITAGKPFIHEVNLHYQSTNIGTKSRTPNFYV